MERLRLVVGLELTYKLHELPEPERWTLQEAQDEAMRITREGYWDEMTFYPSHRISSVTVAKISPLEGELKAEAD